MKTFYAFFSLCYRFIFFILGCNVILGRYNNSLKIINKDVMCNIAFVLHLLTDKTVCVGCNLMYAECTWKTLFGVAKDHVEVTRTSLYLYFNVSVVGGTWSAADHSRRCFIRDGR